MLSFENFLKETKLESIVDSEIREAYIEDQYDVLLEKLITFGGQAYPKFGNVVIMAGGAGSGKGFVKDTLVGIEGRVFDVDELKTLAAKTPIIRKRVMAEFGVDLANLAANLKIADNVARLHEIIGDAMELPDRRAKVFYASILTAAPDRKPNIIFDVTLKDLRKLEKLTRQVSSIGYAKENIHIVWVVNDIEVAIDQNAKRDRIVPVEILVNTHRGASSTMMDVINMGKDLARYMDGDIVFAFNKVGVDSSIAKGVEYGPNPTLDGKAMGPTKSGRKIGMAGSTKGGMVVTDANYFYVKRKGKPVTPQSQLGKDLKAKIQSYVPKNVNWTDI